MEIVKIKSNFDNLKLEVAISRPKGVSIGIVQIVHGMSEHKERYFDFMNFLAKRGYVCIIHDHRGHGNSVKSSNDLGYLYTEDCNAMVEDLYQVTKYIKKKYKGLEIFLFAHSMGSLIARNYLKRYDKEIDKLILCGPPTKNNLAILGLKTAKTLKILEGEKEKSKILNLLVFAGYNRGYSKKNEWISTNTEVVDEYNKDKKSGFIFTINGFINLFSLMIEAFNKKNWVPQNLKLPILVIAGSEDPVIQSKKKFDELIKFLKSVGYEDIESILFEHKRHELINETGKGEIYQEIYEFIKS